MLASNQQFAPALIPARTTPAADASRSATSTPWARQTASMLTVLPPPTYTTSWSPRNAVDVGDVAIEQPQDRGVEARVRERLVEGGTAVRVIPRGGRQEADPGPPRIGQAQDEPVEHRIVHQEPTAPHRHDLPHPDPLRPRYCSRPGPDASVTGRERPPSPGGHRRTRSRVGGRRRACPARRTVGAAGPGTEPDARGSRRRRGRGSLDGRPGTARRRPDRRQHAGRRWTTRRSRDRAHLAAYAGHRAVGVRRPHHRHGDAPGRRGGLSGQGCRRRGHRGLDPSGGDRPREHLGRRRRRHRARVVLPAASRGDRAPALAGARRRDPPLRHGRGPRDPRAAHHGPAHARTRGLRGAGAVPIAAAETARRVVRRGRRPRARHAPRTGHDRACAGRAARDPARHLPLPQQLPPHRPQSRAGRIVGTARGPSRRGDHGARARRTTTRSSPWR